MVVTTEKDPTQTTKNWDATTLTTEWERWKRRRWTRRNTYDKNCECITNGTRSVARSNLSLSSMKEKEGRRWDHNLYRSLPYRYKRGLKIDQRRLVEKKESKDRLDHRLPRSKKMSTHTGSLGIGVSVSQCPSS